MSRRLTVPVLISAVYACALMQAKLQAASGTWNVNNAGNWGTASNWASSVIANDNTSTANFVFDITANRTVTLDSSRTIRTMVFTDATTASHDWTLQRSGTAVLTLAGTSPGISVTNRAATITAVMTGSTPWTKSGGALLVLNAANTFNADADPTVADGTLRVANAGAFGSADQILVTNTAPASGSDNNNLELAGSITIGSGKTLTLRSAAAGGQGRTSLISQSGDNTWAGNIVLEDAFNQGLTANSNTVLRISGSLINGGSPSTQFFLRGGGSGVLNGRMDVGSAAPFKTDSGTWTINSSGNVHGPLGIANGGITVNNDDAIYPLATVTFGEANSNTGTLTINAGRTQALGGINMAGTSVTNNGHRIIGAGTLELNWPSKAINVFDAPAANDLTISTAISGPGGFTKTGPGRLFVNGPSVQGAAIVNAGSLAAQGAFNGGIAVANGTTLIAGGLVTADTLTTPTLAFGAGGTTLEINAGETVADVVQVTSPDGLTQAGTTTINIGAGGGFSVGVYPLISYTGASPGLSGFVLGAKPDSITASLIDTGTAIALDVTAVEQITWAGTTDGTWDDITANWDTVGGPSGVAFGSKDSVIFGDGPTNTSLALVGTIDPQRVEFTADTTAYTLASGTLSGSGAMDLVKSGDGTVILQNANTYAGLTDIQAGTLEIDHDGGTLTATSGVVVGPTATFRVTDDDGDFTMSRSLSGSGTVRVNPNTVASTPAARTATFTGSAAGFTGNLILETPASGSARLSAGAAAVGTSTITVENENQLFCANANTYPNNITITGDGFNDAEGSIGAMRLEGATWDGNITVTGTPGDSTGTNYDARIGANANTSTINGVISGGDLSIITYNNSTITVRLTAANTFGDLIVNSSEDGSGAGGGQIGLILGDNQAVPTNTTATLGTGDVYLVSGTNATDPTNAVLRINRADGYTLATGQDIIGVATGNLQWGGVQLHVDSPGTGFSTGANAINLSDATGGGLIRVAALVNGSVFNIDSGATVSAGSMQIGDATNLSATVNQAAGSTVSVINQIRVGHWPTETSTYNLTAGSLSITGASPAASPSGTGEQNGGIYVGIDGQGIFNQTGGTVTTNWVVLDNRGNSLAGANMPTGIDQYNLTTGSLALKSTWGIIQRNPSAEFNLGGGTISIDNSGTGTGTGTALTVALDTLINVSGTASVLDTVLADNSFALNGNVLGSGTLNLAGSGVIRFNPATPQTISAVLDGATNPVAKTGASTTTLTAANTYSAPTSVEAGTLNIAGSLNNSDLSVLDGATLGGEGSVKSLVLGATVGSNLLIDGATASALTVNGALVHNGTTTVDFAATPTGNSVPVLNYNGGVSGTGTFALANAATYRSSSFSDSGSVVTLNLDLKDLTWTGTDGISPTVWDINGAENWTDGAAQKFFNGDSVTFNDTPGVNQTVAITGTVLPEAVTVNNTAIEYSIGGAGGIGGSASLTKSGTSTLTLTGANTLTGPILVSGGVLKPANVAAFGTSSGITVASGGQVNLNGTAFGNTRAYAYTIEGNGPDDRGAIINEVVSIGSNSAVTSLTLTGDASVGAYGGTVDGNRFDIGFNGTQFGTIDGGGFKLTKVGDAMVNLRTAATNITYEVAAGTLRAENSPLALGSNPVTVSGGRLDTWGTLSFAVPVSFASGTTLTSSNGTATWTGGLDITGDVTFGGSSTINVDGVVSGSGSLIKTDGGTLILSAANTYGGTTTVNGGTLQANHAGAFNVSTVEINNSAAGGRVSVNGGVTLPNNVTVGTGGGILGTVGRGLVESAGTGQGIYSGTVTINSTVSSGGTFLANNVVGNELVFTGPVNTTAGIPISQRDGRVIFAGGGVATGSTFLTTGTTILGANEGLPSGITLSVGGSGAATFEMAGFSQTLAGLIRTTAFNSTVTNSALAVSTLNLDVPSGSPSYSGLISGNLELVKLGDGTQELTTANSYTGTTTVSAGTLQVSNLSGSATGSGAVTVAAGATLAGSGIVGGDVVVDGQVSPGVTTGVLTANSNVTFNSGSTLRIDLGDASAPKQDLLAVVGSLSATGATLDFDVTGTLADSVYVIATYTGSAPTGFTAVDVPAGFVVDYDYNGNSIALVNAYLGWTAENGLTPGVNDGKLQDPDNDGIANVVEFATDGDPLSGEDSGKIRSIIADVDSGAPVVNALTITLPVRAGAVFNGPGDLVSDSVDGIVYKIQSSTNLSDFTTPNVTEVTDNAAILTQLSLPALSSPAWTYRTFRAPGTPGTDVREFLRIVAD